MGWFKGPWRWHYGEDETLSDMNQMDSYEQALAVGSSDFGNEPFYVIEGRVSLLNHIRMQRGKIEFAPFVETRNGHWIEPKEPRP